MKNYKQNLFIILIVFSMLLTISACETLQVRQVVDNPHQFTEKQVELEGVVTGNISVPLSNKGLFELTDESGSIWVYTEQGLPQKGREFIVNGTVKIGGIFLNKSYGVMLIESPREK